MIHKLVLSNTLAFLLLSILSFNSNAQITPIEISNKFFSIYKEVGSNQAVDYLFSTNHYSADSKSEIESIKAKLYESAPSFGQFSGYELISTKMGGKDLELLTFIVKFDRLPLIFKLLFYKPGIDWRIQNFIFNT